MKELIERLEKATGPDRGLDGMIARDVLGWHQHFDLDGDEILDWPDMGGHWHTPQEGQCRGVGKCSPEGHEPPEFTASLDAAMTLVPEGERLDLKREAHYEGGELYNSYACVWGAHGNRSVRAKTLPLALCIASLKALSHA